MRVFRATPEGCLGEISLQVLQKMRLPSIKKKVKTMTGISLRKFVAIKLENKDVLCDIITGTLYDSDGKCMSSDKLMLVDTDEKPHCSIKSMMDKFQYGHGSDYEY